MMALGGSVRLPFPFPFPTLLSSSSNSASTDPYLQTNGVLHYLAMAGTAGVSLTLDDFQRVSNKIPFIADLAPSGKYFMADLYDIGGIPSVMKLLVAAGLLHGDLPTVTGKTIAENLESFPSLPQGQEIIRSLDNPIKKTGHIEILRGNLAPEGAVRYFRHSFHYLRVLTCLLGSQNNR